MFHGTVGTPARQGGQLTSKAHEHSHPAGKANMTVFDPNAAAATDGIFGLPAAPDARIQLLGVPFEATCSGTRGTRNGPRAILAASSAVDLLDPQFGSVWQQGIQLAPLDTGLSQCIATLDESAQPPTETVQVNRASAERSKLVEAWTSRQLTAGKIPGILGGDHSCPLGAIRAAAQEPLSILHFDAHHDLRAAFEGYRESHASIMRNVLEDCPQIDCLVQLGIRDYCEQEFEFAANHAPKIQVQYAHEWAARRFRGENFAQLVSEGLAPLGPRVWVSFDIDALDASCCPATGTPVPGGLSFEEASFILLALAESSRQIIGFDLCEVADAAWDGNVAARILYKLCGLAGG